MRRATRAMRARGTRRATPRPTTHRTIDAQWHDAGTAHVPLTQLPPCAHGGPFAASHALPIATKATHVPVTAVSLANWQYASLQYCVPKSHGDPTATNCTAAHVFWALHPKPF